MNVLRDAVARSVARNGIADARQLANYNAPGQIVISGDADAVRQSRANCGGRGRCAKRVIPLNVSGSVAFAASWNPRKEEFAPSRS